MQSCMGVRPFDSEPTDAEAAFCRAGTIVGVSVAILAILFLIQQFGTATIGYSFAPIVALFFAFNSVIGIYNIAKYSPSIFKVLAPTYWFRYFLRNKSGAWRSLSGVLLSITGYASSPIFDAKPLGSPHWSNCHLPDS